MKVRIKLPKWLLPLLFGGCASAQVVSIAAGSPIAVGSYSADQYFIGGIARPLDTTIGDGIYQTTRFGTNFSYHIPVPVGVYAVVLRLSDPTSTGIGQRVFTVTVNGNTTAPLDIFSLAGGARIPYPLQLLAVAGAGFVDLNFKSTVGNATISGIDIYEQSSVVIASSSQIGEKPCPAGWSGAKLSDGNCLVASQ